MNPPNTTRAMISAHNRAVRRARFLDHLDAALTLALAALAVWIIYTHAPDSLPHHPKPTQTTRTK